MPEQADILLKSLVESGILTADAAGFWGANDSTDATSEAPGPAGPSSHSGVTLIDSLLREGKLSDFQAKVIQQGGPSELILGDYVLLDRIGAGGMGEVFRAMHRVMRREVAIKRLPPHALDMPGLTERFLREVRTAAKLTHPNIVAAYDAGEDESTCFLVMEYVAGRDLSELVKENGPLPVAQAVDYLLQAARAVTFAHASGIVHRDIKPANLLVDDTGTIKLLDLGLARVEQSLAEHEQSMHLTLTGADRIMGTLAYMAPEQAEDPHAAGPAADLYALGCTFCHLVTGRPPFAANAPTQAILAHREQAPPDLSGHLPAALHAVYEELLAKDPADRPATAQQLVDELEALLADGIVPRWEHRPDQGPEAGASQLATLAPASPPSGPGGSHAGQPPASNRPKSTAHERKLRRERAGRRPGYLAVAVGVFVVAALVVALFIALGNGKSKDSAGTEDAEAASPPSAPRGPAPTLLITPDAAAQLQQAQADERGHPTELTNSLGMAFRYIPAARYHRGTTSEQIEWALEQVTAEGLYDRYGEYIATEKPTVVVKIAQPFYVGTTEVTVGQFRRFIDESDYETSAQTDGIGGINFESGSSGLDYHWDNPGFPQSDEHPVVNITQVDAIAFCEWLSKEEGKAYSLPTDDQWEFAARAGSGGRWCFGDDPSGFYDYGWCYNNSPNSTQPVATRKPNRYGLYDMHGNAREWVLLNDGSTASEFGTGIVRGGSFTKPPVLCRSASRVGFKVKGPYPYHSFRVLLQIEDDAE